MSVVSVNEHSAVDVDDGTCDVAGQIGGQKQAGTGHILGFAETIEGNTLQDIPLHVVGQLAGGDVGLDQTRGDRVDPNTIHTKLPRHRLRQSENPGFRRAVVRPTEDAATALGGDDKLYVERFDLAAIARYEKEP